MNFNFRFFLSLFFRRLPVMLALILVCSGIGVVTAYNLPPTYSASARMLVTPPQIPDNLARSLVQTSAEEQLSIIEQSLKTRANLLDIANKFDVFENMRSMNPDEVFQRMDQAVRIRRTGGRNSAMIMRVDFSSRDARTSANVVNEVVTKILEANTDFRMSRAEGTLAFFEQEVARLSTELDAQSARIVRFKSENEGALPDDLSYRLSRQSQLQERLGRLESDRSSAEDQRQNLVNVFESTGRLQGTNNQIPLSGDQRRLLALREQLAELEVVYSDTNPRVISIKTQIEELESRITESPEPSAPDEPAAPSVLEISLAEIDARIERATNEIETTRTELADLEESIARTSGNAIALSALERDFENTQNQYNDAISNLNEARVGERIEVSSQGQRVSVIDSATVPNAPSGPNRTRIAAMGVGAGVALAAGFFVLLELLNFSIRRPAEIESRFGVRPIAAIPYIESGGERFVRRLFLLGALIVVLIGVPAALWYVDNNIMPLERIASRLLDRFDLR